MVARNYKPSRLDDVTVARAARMLRAGVPKPEVMAELGLGQGTVKRIKRGKHPALRRLVRGRPLANRCPGCGGLKRHADDPCLVCPHRVAGAA